MNVIHVYKGLNDNFNMNI